LEPLKHLLQTYTNDLKEMYINEPLIEKETLMDKFESLSSESDKTFILLALAYGDGNNQV
jgi:hypothetical protein